MSISIAESTEEEKQNHPKSHNLRINAIKFLLLHLQSFLSSYACTSFLLQNENQIFIILEIVFSPLTIYHVIFMRFSSMLKTIFHESHFNDSIVWIHQFEPYKSIDDIQPFLTYKNDNFTWFTCIIIYSPSLIFTDI